MVKRIHFQSLAAVLAALLMSVGLPNAFAQNADQATRIKTLIGETYDQPAHKVETAPVVIVGDYALADWIQGKKGGRALLRRTHAEWEIIACGGDGFKEIELLKDAGIPANTARKLVAQLTQAEQSVSPERVKQFGLFGTPNDPRMTDHHSH